MMHLILVQATLWRMRMGEVAFQVMVVEEEVLFGFGAIFHAPNQKDHMVSLMLLNKQEFKLIIRVGQGLESWMGSHGCLFIVHAMDFLVSHSQRPFVTIYLPLCFSYYFQHFLQHQVVIILEGVLATIEHEFGIDKEALSFMYMRL